MQVELELRSYRGTLSAFHPLFESDYGFPVQNRHLTIFDPSEYQDTNKSTLEATVFVLGIGVNSGCTFLVIGCPQVQVLRKSLGFPPKQLHVTLAVQTRDVHTISKDVDTLRAPIEMMLMKQCIEAHLELGLLEQSLFWIEYLLRFEQDNQLLLWRSRIYFQTKQYQLAMQDALQVCLSQESGESLVRLGDAAYKLQEYSTALEAYHKCIIPSTDTKLSQYCNNMIKRLYAKGYTTLELTSLVLGLSEDEWKQYRLLEAQMVEPGTQTIAIMDPTERYFYLQSYKMPRFFSWIVPLVLAGMSTPRNQEDVSILRDLGFTSVITLTEESPLDESWFQGMDHVFWPVTNYYPPSIAHADRFLQLLVDNTFQKRGATLVHCGGGKGRAGSLICCYLVRFGTSVPPKPCFLCSQSPALWCMDSECCFGTFPCMGAQDAIDLIRNLRPGSIETPKQEQFVKEYVSVLYQRMSTGKRVLHPLETPLESKFRIDGQKTLPMLIVMCGLPGSGKSHVSQILRKYGYQIVCQDELGSKSACESAISQFAKQGVRVVVDRCNPTPQDRKMWMSLGPHPAWCLFFDVSPKICQERSQWRFSHPLKPHQAQSAIDSFASQMITPTREEGFDTVCTIGNFDDVAEALRHLNIKIEKRNAFHKYPRTRHLFNLGAVTRDDLLLSEDEAEQFLRAADQEGYTLAAEEKVDGANVGFRLQGEKIICQNRSHDEISQATHKQFAPLSSFIFQHQQDLMRVLSHNVILFGEWLFARHSVEYDQLPTYFIAFDLFDIQSKRFYSRDRFHLLLSQTKICTVARLNPLAWTKQALVELVHEKSCYSRSKREGLVLRIDAGDWLVDKAKIVRPDFIAGNASWDKGPMVCNTLS
ncbi:hypothetical protein EDD86DRAFT_205151 [Gorgonomyces haynaldii]|nr:hypothetical protein EDD86DRAFT_205151 [Gorgonomyces haynaldii]